MKGIIVPPSFIEKLGDLKNPPHVLPQLIDIVLGEAQESVAQQEQRWTHLTTCIPCQAFLGSFLLESIEYDKAHGNDEEPARVLLARLTQSMHTTLEQDIPAYVEVVEEQGEEAANTHYPQFAHHILTCEECQAAVRDLREWLH